MGWLPEDFNHPERVDLSTGHHLRPIRADDVDIDYPAVMGSRERLWEKYGEAWGWPPATMSYEQDRDDLAHHEAEIAAHETFNYAILDEDETELLGCVYIDPPESPGTEPPESLGTDPPESPGTDPPESPGTDPQGSPGADAVVSWWVVDRMVGSELDHELGRFVPRWLNETWGFSAVEFSP